MRVLFKKEDTRHLMLKGDSVSILNPNLEILVRAQGFGICRV